MELRQGIFEAYTSDREVAHRLGPPTDSLMAAEQGRAVHHVREVWPCPLDLCLVYFSTQHFGLHLIWCPTHTHLSFAHNVLKVVLVFPPQIAVTRAVLDNCTGWESLSWI